MGYYCVKCDKDYINILPLVWECPICKARYHEFGYDELKEPYGGDYCNIYFK
jgi:hypothetical protein